MQDIVAAFGEAFRLLAEFDPETYAIIFLSLQVNLAAVLSAAVIGLPLGAALAVFRFPGRRGAIILVNAAMGLPPVVVGLLGYLVLSRSGPLGPLDLLFTPAAMILAQAVLVMPIVAALTRQVIEDLWSEYREQLLSLGCSRARAIPTLLLDGRSSLATVLLAGLGRAAAEVGAVIIVGGNIAHYTRMMTTAITLETGRGNLALALGLGIVLLSISLGLNALAWVIRDRGTRASSAVWDR